MPAESDQHGANMDLSGNRLINVIHMEIDGSIGNVEIDPLQSVSKTTSNLCRIITAKVIGTPGIHRLV